MNDGGPAFPRGYPDSGHGMFLRDWFAGQALAGVSVGMCNVHLIAQKAYEIADAMLLERDKRS